MSCSGFSMEGGNFPEQTSLAVPIETELFPVQVFELEKNETDYLKTIISVRLAGNYQKVSVSQAKGPVKPYST